MITIYLKYIPGDKLVIVPLFATLDTFAFASGGLLNQKFGGRNTLGASFCLATVGSYLIIKAPEYTHVFFLLVTRFGVDIAYS